MKQSIRTHEGRSALVTGPGKVSSSDRSGLAERGAQVIAADLELPQETLDKINSAAHAFRLGVTEKQDW